jgi:hypothetical protein
VACGRLLPHRCLPTDVRPKKRLNLLIRVCLWFLSRRRLVDGSILEAETPQSPVIALAMASTTVTKQLVLTPGSKKTLLLLSALSSTLDSANPAVAAKAALAAGTAAGPAHLMSEHVGAWTTLWESGIEVCALHTILVAAQSCLVSVMSSCLLISSLLRD